MKHYNRGLLLFKENHNKSNGNFHHLQASGCLSDTTDKAINYELTECKKMEMNLCSMKS